MTHFDAFDLLSYTDYKETRLCNTRWACYEWNPLVACNIEEHGSCIVYDYSGGASYTTLHDSLQEAVAVIKRILAPVTRQDRLQNVSLSQTTQQTESLDVEVSTV